MNRRILYRFAAGTMLIGCMFPAASAAAPVSGRFADDARGDAVADQLLTRELGDAAVFPAADALVYHDHRYGFTVGVPNDGVANDWTVHLTNVSGQAWRDVYFVADHGVTIGNADGTVEDLAGAPGAMNDAFRIDSVGANANLLHESMAIDGIFELGEEWEFVVSNFGTGATSRPPTLTTPGVFSGSSQPDPFTGNASLLAVPVPEPSGAVVLMGLGAAALLKRIRRANRVVSHPIATSGSRRSATGA